MFEVIEQTMGDEQEDSAHTQTNSKEVQKINKGAQFRKDIESLNRGISMETDRSPESFAAAFWYECRPNFVTSVVASNGSGLAYPKYSTDTITVNDHHTSLENNDPLAGMELERNESLPGSDSQPILGEARIDLDQISENEEEEVARKIACARSECALSSSAYTVD